MPFKVIGSEQNVECPEGIRAMFGRLDEMAINPPAPLEPKPRGRKPKGDDENPQAQAQAQAPTRKKRASKRDPVLDNDPRLEFVNKRCTTCKEIQPLKSFAKHDTSSDGRASICNRCRNKRNTNRRQTNPDARLKHLLVARILRYHPDIPELTKNLDMYLGYKVPTLRQKLDEQCLKDYGMTLLQCIASGDYHIDHRMPLSHFKIDTPGDEQFRTCWHPDNLKVITADENRAKGATLEEGFDISQIGSETSITDPVSTRSETDPVATRSGPPTDTNEQRY